MMMVSFYRFFDVQDPDTVRSQLFGLWKSFGALGRIYVAKEGLNAQMAIPSNVLDRFTRACHSFPGLEGIVINTDHEIPMVMFNESPPFSNLHIRLRDQILRDGLDDELDWYQSGYEMPADEWHEKLGDPNAVILDCRNSYESDVSLLVCAAQSVMIGKLPTHLVAAGVAWGRSVDSKTRSRSTRRNSARAGR
jgi:UPF0176 protein